MAASYRIDVERRRIYRTFEGEVTDEDLLDGTRQMRADPDYDGSFDVLVDARGTHRADVSSDAIRELARLSPKARGARRAIVVGSDIVYGLARMFQLLREDQPEDVRVFRDRDEAERWLERDPADPEP